MNYNNILDIIKNNINLFNCIKLKFQDWYKLELRQKKLDFKKDIYFYQSIDLKSWNIIYTSQFYEYKKLSYLNNEIEILILENIDHLKDILENHINILNNYKNIDIKN